MKKILGILGGTVFALTLFLNAAIILDEVNGEDISIISESKARILYEPNFSLQDVAFRSGLQGVVGVGEIGFWGELIYSWTYIRCCMQSVDANSCNFDMEDPLCKQHAIRPSRPSGNL